MNKEKKYLNYKDWKNNVAYEHEKQVKYIEIPFLALYVFSSTLFILELEKINSNPIIFCGFIVCVCGLLFIILALVFAGDDNDKFSEESYVEYVDKKISEQQELKKKTTQENKKKFKEYNYK